MKYRELRFVGKPDEATRTVPVAVSSDTPYDRGAYVEILDHSPSSVDLSRAPLPLIESHDDRRLNIGIVEDLRVEGGRLRGVARFGSSARALEVFEDVTKRIVRGVSIGYELTDSGRPTPHPSGRGRRFKFRPYEVSVVAVPADVTVGFYRSKDKSMNDDLNTADNGESQPQSRSQRRAMASAADDGTMFERERVRGINALATAHDMRELGDRAIAAGASLEAFRGMALDALHQRGSNRPLYQPPSQIGLSRAETQQFSLARLYRSMISNTPNDAPFERECVRAVQTRMERAGCAPTRGGLLLPYEVMTSPIPGLELRGGALSVGDRVLFRDLSSLSAGAGAAMVGTDLLAADFLTILRARTMVLTMGAVRLTGLVGNVSIPRQIGTITPGWVAQAAAATESDASFSAVTLSPKTAHGMQDVTRDLLIQGTPAVEGIIRADLLDAMAVTIDYAALNGTGINNQPAGLTLTPGLGVVPGGTNGAAPTWDHAVSLEEQVASSNGLRGAMGYLTNPKVRSRLKRTQKFNGTNGAEVFERPFDGDDAGAFGVLNGYRCGVTTQVRSDFIKGTSVGVCSGIYFGHWPDLMIGEWATPEILPDPYTQGANRIVRMHVWQSVDVAVRRPGSFSVMLDALTP